MEIHPIIDPYAIHYDSFAGDVYTIDTASITLTGGTLTAAGLTTAGTITDGTLSIASGSITSAVNGTFSGTGTFGKITIFNPIPILVFKDNTYAGDVSLGYIEWRDVNNTRLGFFGNASSSNDDLYWVNESSGGHIKIETTGAGEFQIFANTYITDRLGIGTTTYTERLNLTDTTADAATKMQTGLTPPLGSSPLPWLPGSASEGTITDNGYPWTNPTNITNGGSADCTINEDFSDDLRAYNFGFDSGETQEIPADATITGIIVTINRSASDSEAVRDFSIKLVDRDGSVVGDNKADVGTLWPDSQTTAAYGGASDMWGTSLTAADIRDSDFGVDIEIETDTEVQNETGYVYWVKIQVYYTRLTYYTAGIDETDLSYKIAYNSALGGTDRFTIDPNGNFDFQTGVLQTGNAIYFTQTDGAERIDSLADGYMDYFAGTAHRFNAPVRGSTSLWWRIQHIDLASIPALGAVGATYTPQSVNNLTGYQLDNNPAEEYLYFNTHVGADWDEASDLEVFVQFETNVNNGGGLVTDTVDFDLVLYYKGDGETAQKTQDLDASVVVGQAAQFYHEEVMFTIDYDKVDHVVEIGDCISFRLHLNDTDGEVDDVIAHHAMFRYKTNKVRAEV